MLKIKMIITLTIVLAIVSCGGEEPQKKNEESGSEVVEEKIEVGEQPVEESAEAVSENFMENKGIGPVKSLTLGEIDEALVEKGKEIYKANCTACHKFEKRVVGPALAGVVQRRSPEWIMNMMLNPEVMVEKDPIAKQLLEEYLSPMANQNLTEEEARAILELFRTKN